jgi:transposase
MADKGYDAVATREELLSHGYKSVVPSKSNHRGHIPLDHKACREGNLIERFFNRLTNWRRIATRFDTTAVSLISFVQIVTSKLSIPFVDRI